MTKISWTDETWNPVTGCSHVSEGCRNCLGPSTRVLMRDAAWRRIDQIHEGDEVLGFTEGGELGVNRVLLPSTVEAVWRTTAPTIEFETASGIKIVSSEDHSWLSAVRPYWRRAAGFGLSARLRRIADPQRGQNTDDPGYMAGYVAGVTAGDGTMRFDPSWRSNRLGFPQMYWRVAMLETDRVVLDRLVAYLDAFGVVVDVRPFARAGYSEAVCGRAIKNATKAMLKVECRSHAALQAITDLLQEMPSPSWRAGWLAGFLDADGSSDGKSIRWSQAKENDYLERTRRYASDLGFEVRIEPRYGQRATTARLYAKNLAERMSFLTTVRPALPRKCVDPYFHTLFAAIDDPVVAVRRGPVRELVDITTSTRTFVAEGLATHNCYAETLSLRFGWSKKPWTARNAAENVILHPDRLRKPYAWKGSRRCFVNSMSDLFHELVPVSFIDQVFAVMESLPQHTFQVLTKRPERMRTYLFGRWVDKISWSGPDTAPAPWIGHGYYPGHIWLGTSVEDSRVLRRVADLRQVPAAVRFLSCEPLLGPLTDLDLQGIHWVIVGGESGLHMARPENAHRWMDHAWAREIRDMCVTHEPRVAYFFKQSSGVRTEMGTELEDGYGGLQHWQEYPAV